MPRIDEIREPLLPGAGMTLAGFIPRKGDVVLMRQGWSMIAHHASSEMTIGADHVLVGMDPRTHEERYAHPDWIISIQSKP